MIAGHATCNLTINNVLPICDILNGLSCVIAGKYPPDTYNMHSILIGYYTVDCTILKYIWTSAQMTTILDEQKGESNMVKSSGHEKFKMERIRTKWTSTRAQRVHGSGIVHVLFSY